jgi:hypothetical protein
MSKPKESLSSTGSDSFWLKYRKNLPIPAKIAIFAVKYGNKLADKLEVWSIYQLANLPKSMASQSVQLEITALRGRLKGLS